jgi:hypothetical protein
MFVITYNVNERIFTGICKKFSGVTEANSSYRPPEKKKIGTHSQVSQILTAELLSTYSDYV